MAANAEPDDGPFFERELERRFGHPEPGDYAIELMASRGIRLTDSNSGAVLLWFCIRIEGPPSGRELWLSFVVDGPKSMAPLVRRSLKVLDDWRRGTGTPRATNYVSLLRDIARNGRRVNVLATVGRGRTAGGDAISTLIKVRIEGLRR